MNVLRTRSLRRALVVVVATGCGSRAGGTLSSSGPESPRQRLLRADIAAGSPVAGSTSEIVARYMADDAVMLMPRRGYVLSRDSVRAQLAADSLFRGTAITWRPIGADVSRDGTHGYTFGYSELTKPGIAATPGKYLAYWRRDPAGEWRIIAFKLLRRPTGPVSTGVLTESSESSSTGTTGPTGDAALRELMQVDREFSRLAQRGPADAFRAYAAPTAMTTGSGPEFAIGRERVAAEFSSFVPGSLAWKPIFGAIAPSGDLAFVTGDVEIGEPQANGPMKVQAVGQYLTVWRRQADGTWKFVADA